MTNHLFEPNQMKVLLVDDTPANIDVLSKTLRPEGYKLAIAQSGEKALKIADHFRPDLILLDVMMPGGIDGIETCLQLKSKATTRQIPIIFITAKTASEDIVKGFQVGGIDYITKPFNNEEVCVRVKTQLQLQSFVRKLVQLNDEKNKFIGITAHDLRNPLSGMLGFAELLLDENETMPIEERQECLRIIRNGCSDALSTVNNLLDTASINHGSLTLNFQLTTLIELIADRLMLHSLKAENKNIILKTNYAEVPDVYIDQRRIAHVIDNLLDNAIKFSLPDSEINVVLSQEYRVVKVSIQDQGSGISTQDQTKLFQYFQALGSSGKQEEHYHGLGLAIAKQVVDAHHGQLEIDSEIGKGATFSFTVPLDHPLSLKK